MGVCDLKILPHMCIKLPGRGVGPARKVFVGLLTYLCCLYAGRAGIQGAIGGSSSYSALVIVRAIAQLGAIIVKVLLSRFFSA